MAKKKDITRNPPSWLEKGLFVLMILVIVGIAFPIFWELNASTRELYDCYGEWKPLLECLNEWKEETGASKYDKISVDEMRRRYQEKTGRTEFPCCPSDPEKQLYNQRTGTVGCSDHAYIEGLGEIETEKDKKKNNKE